MPKARDGSQRVSEKVKTPLSQVDPAAILLLIEAEKELIQPIDTDVKDGKRRVSAVKGPKKKTANQEAGESESD